MGSSIPPAAGQALPIRLSAAAPQEVAKPARLKVTLNPPPETTAQRMVAAAAAAHSQGLTS